MPFAATLIAALVAGFVAREALDLPLVAAMAIALVGWPRRRLRGAAGAALIRRRRASAPGCLGVDADRDAVGTRRDASNEGRVLMVNDNLAEAARAAQTGVSRAGSAAACTASSRSIPRSSRIHDHRERGKVVNAAWNGYNLINALSLGAVGLGWFASRLTETQPQRLSERERKLAMAKDGFTLAALATGIANGVEGARLASLEPEGAVPIERGTTPRRRRR